MEVAEGYRQDRLAYERTDIMDRSIFSLLLVVLLTLPMHALAAAPEGYPFVPFDQAMAQSRSESKLLFVYFGRYGCGYCEKTNREAFIDPAVRQRYSENYALAYVDAESGRRLRLPSGERIAERDLGTRYEALVTPVFTFLKPDGAHCQVNGFKAA